MRKRGQFEHTLFFIRTCSSSCASLTYQLDLARRGRCSPLDDLPRRLVPYGLCHSHSPFRSGQPLLSEPEMVLLDSRQQPPVFESSRSIQKTSSLVVIVAYYCGFKPESPSCRVGDGCGPMCLFADYLFEVWLVSQMCRPPVVSGRSQKLAR